MKKFFTGIACIIALLFSVTVSAQPVPSVREEKDIAYYTAHAPFTMPAVPLPKFNEKIFSIADYGAVNDGKTLCTEAFAKAIEACSKAGGGRVLVPSGIWLTGPIELKSNIDLHTEKNALIQFTTDHTQYPIINMNGMEKLL